MTFRAWFSWGIAAAFVLYQFLLQASTSVMVPQLENAFKIDVASVGFLSASFFYPYVFLQMPAGCLVDKFGARRILCGSIIGCSLACVLFAFAPNVWIAELSRLIMGITTASAVVSALYLAVNWFPIERFALLAGLTEMLGMLGGALGQNILAYGVNHIGWRGTLIFCGIAGIILAVLAIALVFDHPPEKPQLAHSERSMLNEFWQVLRLPQVWLSGTFGGLVFALITGFAALWSVPYLTKLYGISLTTAAAASSMVFWGAALGGPVAGWITGYFATRRRVMQIGTLLVLLLSLIIFYCPRVPLSAMFGALFGLGFFSGVYVLMFSVVCDVVPANLRGTAMGFTNMMCILLGAPILQPLIGWLLKLQLTLSYTGGSENFTVDNYRIAFTVFPVGLLLALVCLFYVRDQSHQH